MPGKDAPVCRGDWQIADKFGRFTVLNHSGVCVNDVKIASHPLRPGDKVVFGRGAGVSIGKQLIDRASPFRLHVEVAPTSSRGKRKLDEVDEVARLTALLDETKRAKEVRGITPG